MPTRRVSSFERAIQLRLVMGFDENVHVKIMRGCVERAWPRASVTQAMMIRMQSAPEARAS